MSQFNTLAPDALDRARARVHEATTSYELAVIALELLGLDRYTAVQATPNLNKKTRTRLNAYWPKEDSTQGPEKGPKQKTGPGETSSTVKKTLSTGLGTVSKALSHKPRAVQQMQDSVHMLCFSLSKNKKHIPEGQQALLPPELVPVKEAAEAAGVSPLTALKAVAFHRNPVDRVLKELDTLKHLRAAGKAKTPTGLFIHAMKTGIELQLPASLQRQLDKAAEPKPEPLQAGEQLPYEGRSVTVLEVGPNITRLLDDDGTPFTMGTDAATRLRGQTKRTTPKRAELTRATPPTPPTPTATEDFVQHLLQRFKNREFSPNTA